MPSRNVAVQQDVYAALRKEKRPGESFTRLFERLLSQRGPLEELSGSWNHRGSEVGRRLLMRWRNPSTSGRKRR